MVSFYCQSCNDTVKKPKLAVHMNRCQAPVDCIDCSTTFDDQTAKSHTSCITEEQKYQKNLYQKPNKVRFIFLANHRAIDSKMKSKDVKMQETTAEEPAPTQEKKKKRSKAEKSEKTDEVVEDGEKETKKRKKSKKKTEDDDDGDKSNDKDAEEPSKKKKKSKSTGSDDGEKPKKKKKSKRDEAEPDVDTDTNEEKPKKKKKKSKKSTDDGAIDDSLFTEDDVRQSIHTVLQNCEKNTKLVFPKLIMLVLQNLIEFKQSQDTDVSEESLTAAHRQIADSVLRSLSFVKSDDGDKMTLQVI